jgi:cytoskeletal protein RodZ
MEEKKSAAFGSYLKTVRLEKGIKLSAISVKTRISKDTLAALEDEDHERLPADVFVKGFIRAYARVVDADGDVAVKGFIESRRQLGEERPIRTDVIGGQPDKRGRLPLFLGILLVIVAGAIVMLRTTTPDSVEKPTPPPVPLETPADKQAVAAVKAAPEPAPPPAPPVPPEPVKPQPATIEAAPPAPAPDVRSEAAAIETAAPLDRQRIQIQVVEDTWLKVIIDSLRTSEYSLAPGDTLELEADKGFNLLIGNATGIQLTFNDQPVPVPGKTGQVVTIQLP